MSAATAQLLDGAALAATIKRDLGGQIEQLRSQGITPGLGTILVNYFITMARENGLHYLTCMLFSDVEADAVRTLEQLGFEKHLFPGYGTDPDGNPHDMVKLTLRV